ncbi:hypothetical protein MKZ38_001954 [Zalerion maritima]|uniref:Scaffold protein Nfu/NifU N-terminal domain-containing protein n=1 Tax=Zalerion maritima TaxID=339359 RepID=A0AAD5WR55_9PEZI|nr:hypothetical protein MKZ38_001954 [Zalerion maritima]
MPGNLVRTGARILSGAWARPSAPGRAAAAASLAVSSSATQTGNTTTTPPGMRSVTTAAATARPRIVSQSSPLKSFSQRRTLFIRTDTTPNRDALKFLPGVEVKPSSISSPFIEYLTPRSTIAPPYPSQLASKLMSVDGVTSVFYGADFITVTKAEDVLWEHIKPEIFALITEAVTSGEKLVFIADKPSQTSAAGGEQAAADRNEGGAEGELDSLAYDENDDETVGMIKELLETRIRPTIQQDGGDIEFVGFKGGQVMLKLRGACRTCDSSTATLKDGIEKMLSHYIEEVEGVTQVLDEAEEIAVKEFAKFEEQLKNQKRSNMEQAA